MVEDDTADQTSGGGGGESPEPTQAGTTSGEGEVPDPEKVKGGDEEAVNEDDILTEEEMAAAVTDAAALVVNSGGRINRANALKMVISTMIEERKAKKDAPNPTTGSNKVEAVVTAAATRAANEAALNETDPAAAKTEPTTKATATETAEERRSRLLRLAQAAKKKSGSPGGGGATIGDLKDNVAAAKNVAVTVPVVTPPAAPLTNTAVAPPSQPTVDVPPTERPTQLMSASSLTDDEVLQELESRRQKAEAFLSRFSATGMTTATPTAPKPTVTTTPAATPTNPMLIQTSYADTPATDSDCIDPEVSRQAKVFPNE
jgi:hypothetical protein